MSRSASGLALGDRSVWRFSAGKIEQRILKEYSKETLQILYDSLNRSCPLRWVAPTCSLDSELSAGLTYRIVADFTVWPKLDR
jgi:hypothetical protein